VEYIFIDLTPVLLLIEEHTSLFNSMNDYDNVRCECCWQWDAMEFCCMCFRDIRILQTLRSGLMKS